MGLKIKLRPGENIRFLVRHADLVRDEQHGRQLRLMGTLAGVSAPRVVYLPAWFVETFEAAGAELVGGEGGHGHLNMRAAVREWDIALLARPGFAAAPTYRVTPVVAGERPAPGGLRPVWSARPASS